MEPSTIESQFKVGDWVTPDEEFITSSFINKEDVIFSAFGQVFRIVSINDYGFELDRGIGKATRDGWRDDIWKHAKNQIVRNILNDL